LHMAQLMPLPLTVSCFSKIQTGFTFLVPAHPGSPGQRAVKRVCVCVSISFFWFLCLRPSTRWSRRYYVFGWSVCRCVRAYVHTSLTKQQTTSLEYIQRRALQIIAGNILCKEACCLFKLTSLAEIRDSLCSKLFRQLVSQSHVLHCLLPAQRDDGLTGRLRSSVLSSSTHSDQPFQKLIYTIRCS